MLTFSHCRYPTRLLSDRDIDPAAAELAFRIQRPSLLIAIDSTHELTNLLYSKGAISREVRNKLSVISLSQDEKNMLLLNEVEDKIMTNSSMFQTFISALQSEPLLAEMATQLLDSYRTFPRSLHIPDRSHDPDMTVRCNTVTTVVRLYRDLP